MRLEVRPERRQVNAVLLEEDGRGRMTGRDPRRIALDDYALAGIEPMALIDAIRLKCLDCSTPSEVRACPATSCVLWPYRLGFDPFRGKRARQRT